MKTLFTFLFAIFSFTVIAQIPEPAMLWLKGYGGNGDDQIGAGVTPTSDGGFILQIASTSVYGTGNLDSFCSMSGDRSIFLKYNSDATILEWSLCTTNGSYLFPVDSGNFILGGLTTSTGWAFKIIKQNSLGAITWEKTYGNNADAILKGMIATNDGGYIMAGETNYADTDFLTHYGSFMNADIGILKLDSLGNKMWSTVLGGTGNQQCGAIVAGLHNECYVVGTTTSDDNDCTGNHGGTSGTSDAYLARLDANGNIIWHKDMGGTGYDGGECGWPDGNGGVIIGGTTNSHDGDVTHYAGGIWVIDVDSNGNILWNNSYGNDGSESPNAICRATDGSIWIAGVSGTQGGEIDTAYGSTDAWFVHTDATGNFLNAKVLGSSGQDEGYMVYPLSGGGVIAGGYYENAGGAFPNVSWGSGDAFLLTFAAWPESVQINTMNGNMKIYPNPANEIVTIEAEQKDRYSVVITDVLGRTVYKTTLQNKIHVNVNGWQAGIYYVQVANSDGYRDVQKLMVV